MGSVFNRPHGDEAKTSRPAGLYSTNFRYVLRRDRNAARPTHPLVIHDNNLFNLSMSAEFILKIPFGGADRQTKYSQDVCRFYFGEDVWGPRRGFGGNGVRTSRIWRRGWSYSIRVESHPVNCSAYYFCARRCKFLNRIKDYGMNRRCLIYSSTLSTELLGQRIRIDSSHEKAQRMIPNTEDNQKPKKGCQTESVFNRILAEFLCWSNDCATNAFPYERHLQFVPFVALSIIFTNKFFKISFPADSCWRSLWKWRAYSWRIDDVARIWRVVLPWPRRRWHIGCRKGL